MPLEQELQRFEALKPDLLAHHEGKFALIIGDELEGVYDHREDAYKAGIAKRGNVPMLIRQIVREEPTESIPAMVLGLLGARI